MDNKFDSFTFRVRLNINQDLDLSEIRSMKELFPDNSKEEDEVCFEEIRLKIH